MPEREAEPLPIATYRLQLHGKFPFDAARKHLDWIAGLGASHLYLSPIFTATPGSLHGYDVSDYHSINPELGGRDGFNRLSDGLRKRDMHALLDFVPNHMGIAGPLNRWWLDVLEKGRLSPYAEFFDIQWKSADGQRAARVLVPLLRDHYGRELEQAAIRLGCDGSFTVSYGDAALPLNPQSYRKLIKPLAEDAQLSVAVRREARRLAENFAVARPAQNAATEIIGVYADHIRQAKDEFRLFWSAEPAVRDALAARLRQLNGVKGSPGSFMALHALLETQHYRLARWKSGAHEINYRRFFAIDSLVGLRMERPEVFRATHALLAELIAEKRVAGVRVDHIDGLREPEKYLAALHRLPGPAARPRYVVVEKILARNETLPASWPVQGTTGYDFIPHLADLFVAADAEEKFTGLYAGFTGDTVSFAETVAAKKRLVITELFADAVNRLGEDLALIIRRDWHWRDLTRHELIHAISETITEFDVYRTYRTTTGEASPADRRVLHEACARVLARNPIADPQPFEFLRDVLTGSYPPAAAPAAYRQRVTEWVLTFQQYTGAVMAKAVEDTAYYTSCRLIALNEVGGHPGSFGGSLENFHAANQARLAATPLTLLTTSTHDTKLSEDVRARLYALSEITDEWAQWLPAWHELTAPYRSRVHGHEAPDRLDEYRFYQVLLGVWPLEAADVDDNFRARLREHFRKAVSEAKRHTSALHPNEAYLQACDRFVEGLATANRDKTFAASFLPATRRLAHLGMINSLAQLVLKCTVPGIPDFYQGNETWDFSLVDPDNRRPVDFARMASLRRPTPPTPVELFTTWRDGAIKLRVTERLLAFRRGHPRLFTHGAYEPLRATGEFADHVVAFVRHDPAKTIVTVVPRLTARLGVPPLGVVWEETALPLPAAAGPWRDLFTDRHYPPTAQHALRTLLQDLPFAVLETTEEPTS